MPTQSNDPPPRAAGVHERLADHFGKLSAAFERIAAAGRHAVTEHRLALAGQRLRLRLAGRALAPVLLPALAHLAADPADEPDLDICCWDGAETGVTPPEPPWVRQADAGPGRMILPTGGEQFRVSDPGDGLLLSVLRLDAGRAVFWSRDARRLPTFQHAAPLLEILHAWNRSRGLTVLHAGCVGRERGAVLLGGRGGSGKSTTSLLCLEAGLHYAGDDYCLLEPGPVPVIHCLYGSAKLHRSDLARFPRLAALAEDPVPDAFEKPVIHLRRRFADRLASSLPLRAVVLPRVADQEETTFAPLPAAEALRDLAPSTLFQLPGEGAAPLQSMASLVRRLPCFRLHLGRRLESVAPAVQALLDHVA